MGTLSWQLSPAGKQENSSVCLGLIFPAK